MNVLSLFDGMSCGQLALNKIGIKYEKYFASEVDKYAIKVTQSNYPNTVQLGDVCGIQYEDGALFHHQNDDPLKNGGSYITKIDLLIGGSPCQGFSFAGRQLNFEDPRSKLFFEFVRLLKEIKPKYFLLENVPMKKEYENVISEYLGVDPIKINSRLVSGQNRERLYWTNIPNISQPEDKGIMLKDIIINPVDPSLIHTDIALEYMDRTVKGGRNHWDFKQHSDVQNVKSSAIVANIFKGVPFNVLIDSNCIRKFDPIEVERLQTVPDNYTKVVSNTQRYKMLGNGWTVDVIAHIFSFMK